MYINKINIKNVGPIDDFSINLNFNKENLPNPLIIMGSNGTGKTIFSSYIADFFVEYGKLFYNDIVNESTSYFRVSGGNNIKINNNYSFACIEAKDNDKYVTYYEKTGKIPDECRDKFDNYKQKDRIININNSEEEINKEILLTDNKFNAFEDNVLAYFTSYRNEKPDWYNDNSIEYPKILKSFKRFSNKLSKEIIVSQTNITNEVWLERILSDSYAKVKKNNNNTYSFDNGNSLLDISIDLVKKIESFLSKILKVANIHLVLGNRMNDYRIKIVGDKTIPSLAHLSLGESILFNLFLTIIRLYDNGGYINFDEIKGVVVIDEIDMHLDSDMQYNALPQLFKEFKKVQFIITTHSPLFTLGMKKEYGNNCDFIEMPNGNHIDVEDFNEFLYAYNCLKESKKFEQEMMLKFNEYLSKNILSKKPLIVTEGPTDWKHLENALEYLKTKNMFKNLDFEFYEFESNDISMGYKSLINICKDASKIPNDRKIICIFDNDVLEIKKTFGNSEYKSFGNNIYGFSLPIPEFRKETPNISIEHLYSDEEIKTFVRCDDNNSRRLFMFNEFNSYGFSDEYVCITHEQKNFGSISIIDGNSKHKIAKKDNTSDDCINYALSKMKFVSAIKDGTIKISDESYNNFIKVFEIIEKIIKE